MFYTRDKIVRLVEATATLFDVNISELKVCYGSALVMHGIRTQTEDVDISVSPEVWEKITTLTKLDDQFCSPVIHMTTAVEIRPISTLPVKQVFSKMPHGIFVATPCSLLKAYKHLATLTDRPAAKNAADLRAVTDLERAFETARNERRITANRSFRKLTENIVSWLERLDIGDNLKQFHEVDVDSTSVLVGDIANSHTLWDITFDKKTNSFSFYKHPSKIPHYVLTVRGDAE